MTKPDESAGAAQAEVQVKTEVDVPAEGIHETIVQTGTEVSHVIALFSLCVCVCVCV